VKGGKLVRSTYQRLKTRRCSNETDGFTLIEILIVIVVLGILAAVVIYALTGIGSKTAVAACEADGATVTSALADFNTQNPTQFDNVAGVGSNPPTSYSALTAEAILSSTSYGAPYIQAWPNNYPHSAFTLNWTQQTPGIWSEELYVATGEQRGGTAPNYTYSGAGDGTGPGNLIPSGTPAADIPGSVGGNAPWLLYTGPGSCTGVK
jgi:general secretion pathway protein G